MVESTSKSTNDPVPGDRLTKDRSVTSGSRSAAPLSQPFCLARLNLFPHASSLHQLAASITAVGATVSGKGSFPYERKKLERLYRLRPSFELAFLPSSPLLSSSPLHPFGISPFSPPFSATRAFVPIQSLGCLLHRSLHSQKNPEPQGRGSPK
jgi:hypothetical protein